MQYNAIVQKVQSKTLIQNINVQYAQIKFDKISTIEIKKRLPHENTFDIFKLRKRLRPFRKAKTVSKRSKEPTEGREGVPHIK